MELFQVRYVLAVARELNFTKAAAVCGVSQPALTKAIKSMEGELGAPLFHREGRRILLSGLGRSLLPHFEHMAEEADTTRILADNFRLMNKVPVRLGVMSTIGPLRVSRFLAAFQADFDGVEVAVTEGSAADLRLKLERDELDVTMLNAGNGIGEGLNVHRLYEERYVLVLPRDHPLAASPVIALNELNGADTSTGFPARCGKWS